MLKRIFDIFCSILGIIALIVIFPFVAIAILLESGWPIIVSLPRISNGRRIYVYKFRSMVRNARAMKKGLAHLNERSDGPLFKIKNDPRLTRVGKILRKLRVDEFPQFINVLKGDLSLVGPRPHEEEEIDGYPEEFKILSSAKAGLTGLSQVSGASGLPFLKEIELDKFYLEHQSFWLDMRILFKTIWILFSDPTGV
ncbi:MAG: sugar transferase [bacterium]|nr:sugar transferase [Candidatus Jorgensenbacteria bacterium]